MQTLGEDPATGVRRTAPHACSLLGVREGNAHSLHGAPGLGIGRRAQTARSEGPALLGNVTLQRSRRSASLATQPLSKSPKPLFCRPFSRSPNTLCSSPSLRANPQLSPESYSLRFRYGLSQGRRLLEGDLEDFGLGGGVEIERLQFFRLPAERAPAPLLGAKRPSESCLLACPTRVQLLGRIKAATNPLVSPVGSLSGEGAGGGKKPM